MNIVPLQLSRKGNRSYLHGTDMYDAIMSVLEARGHVEGPIRLKIGRETNRTLSLYVAPVNDATTRPADEVANFAATVDGIAVTGWLVESGGLVVDRYEYDEMPVEEAGRIDDDAIRFIGVSPISPIETAIALTRRLHVVRMPPGGSKWMFTGLEIARPLRACDARNMTVTLRHRLGFRLTKSALQAGTEEVGYIYFSLVAR